MDSSLQVQLNKFLHREAPVHGICLYRLLVGTLVFLESASWLPYTRELFSNQGFHVANLDWMPAPPPALAFLLCLAMTLAGLCVALGLFTRPAIAVTLALWSYFYSLDSINEKAAQTIVIIVLTILFFSRCGDRLSLDDARAARRGKRAKGTSSIFFQRLLQVEFAQIYFFSGVAKMTNPEWVSGTTFYWILNGRWATPLGTFLSAQDLNIVARAGGLGTILFELFMGFLLLTPFTRPVAIAMGLGFHVGIQLTLWIGTLGCHFISALLAVMPEPETIQARTEQLSAFLSRTRKLSKN
jgi:uncharacterized membrane protein YphA (DoxX/SURF4 family)